LVVVIGVGVTTCRIGDLLTVPEAGLIFTIPGADQGADSVLKGNAAYKSTAPRVMKVFVGHTGKSQLQWKARVGGTHPWLSIRNTTGSSGDTILVVAEPDTLSINTYRDSIIVDNTSASGSAVVPVMFEVDSCAVTSIPSAGGEKTDTLNTADCGAPHHSPKQAQIFSFDGVAGNVATVLLSAGFNGFIALETSLDSTVPPLNSAVDCLGDSKNPCIYYFQLPQSTTYFIEVSGASAADTGVFSVRLMPGAARRPNTVQNLEQRLVPDSSQVVPINGPVGQYVLVHGVVSDSDLVDSLVLEAEWQPVDTPFTGQARATSTRFAANNGVASVLLGPLTDNKAYHWQVRARDEKNNLSTQATQWDSLPNGGSPDFTAQIGHDPALPQNLTQLQSDGSSVINVGGTATTTTVKFRGLVQDIDVGDVLHLEVEVELLGIDTTGQPSPTQTPTFVSSGNTSIATVSAPTIQEGLYHWIARTVDQGGRHSKWVSFGGNAESELDFKDSVANPVNLVITTGPGSQTTAGVAISPSVVVTAQNQFGQTITTFNSPVTMTIASGPGPFAPSATTNVNAASGVATFSNLVINKAGPGYTLVATSGTTNSVASNSFTIVPASVSQLVFTGPPPASMTAGVPFSPTIQVSGEDPFGNVNQSFGGLVTLTIAANPGNPPGTLRGLAQVNASSGVAAFPTVNIDKIGNGYTLRAGATGLTPDTSGAINITAAPVTHLVFAAQPSTTAAGVTIVPAVQVAGRDSLDNTVPSFTSLVTVAIGTNPPGNGFLSGTKQMNAVSGVAMFSTLSIDKIGTGYTLTANAGGLPQATSAAFNIITSTVDSTKSTVTASTPIAACAAGCTTGGGTASLITITVHDGLDNPVVGANVTLSATGFNVNFTQPAPTNASGVTTGTLFSDSAQVKVVTAVANGIGISTHPPVTVNPGPAASLAFFIQPSNTGAGAAINSGTGVVVLAKDQFGNTAASFTSTVTMAIAAGPGPFAPTSLNSTPASAGVATFSNLRIYQAGSGYQLQASGGGLPPSPLSSPAFNITVGPAVRDTFSVQPLTTAVLARIDSVQNGIKVSITDSVGNVVTTDNTHTITMAIFSQPGGASLGGQNPKTVVAGVATFTDLTLDKLGTYTLSAVSNLPTNPSDISAPFNIVPGPASALAFTHQPTDAVAGALIDSATSGVQVTALDAHGFVATSFTGNVTVAIGTNPSGGTLSGTRVVPATSGVAAFTTLRIDKVGTGYTLTGSATGLSMGTSQPFNILQGGVSASQSQVSSAPATITACKTGCSAGSGTASTITVIAKDAQGNGVAGATVTLASTSTSANITQPAGVTNGSGQITGTVSDTTTGSQTITATVTLSPNPPVQVTLTATVSVNAAAPAAVLFIRNPTTTTAGATITPATGVQVQINDQFGNRTTATSSVLLSILVPPSPGGATLFGTNPRNAINGIATFNDLHIDKTGNGYQLLAASTSLVSDSSTLFSIVSGGATKLGFVQQPTSENGGVAITPAVTVEVEDALGNRVTSATNNITVAIGTNPNNGTLGGVKTVAAVSGLATFSNLSIDSAGVGYTLAASASGLTGTVSSGFTIAVGPAAKLGFHVQPSATAGGATITPAVQVEVQDLGGNRVTTANNTVSVAIGTNPSGGTLSGNAPVSASSGIAQFSNLSIDKSGNPYTLTAAATGLTGATSAPFSITTGTATKLAFVQQPTSTTGGATITPAVTVEVEDAGGNRVTSATNSITVAIGTNPSNGTLGGVKTVAASSGLATFNLSIDSAGTPYTLAASASGLTGATSNNFNITVGTASKLGFLVQPSNAAGGATITPAVEVEIRDAGGNRVTTANNSVTVAIGTNPNSGTLGGPKTQAAVSGIAMFSNLSIDSAGAPYTLTAAATGLTGATSNTFTISVGAATKLGFRVQPNSPTGGVAFSPNVQVEVRDAGGNRVTSASTSIQLTLNGGDAAASLSGSNPVSASSGLATFSGLSVDSAANNYTLVATGGGFTQATSTAFNVTVGSAAQIAFHTEPTTTTAGQTITPNVQVEIQDAGGNRVNTNAQVTVAISNNAGGGTLSGTLTKNATSGLATFNNISINKTGTGYTLGASEGAFNTTSSGFNITPAAADHMLFTVQPTDAVNGNSISPAVEVTVFDQFGNIANFNGTITLTVTGGGSGITGNSVSASAGVATFSNLILDTPGTYTLDADGGGLTTVQSGSFTIS
jgi:Bacterial Ig-like domain (group 1)